ncbi:uncharacterized protein LOC105213679 isoform X1 [Zeugodacus cucurbitae]|uniref:uncharacterized protein LOC105213679 isoform X1 n=1 Tax=Zeugodacus cucurbitae TaxID=28588 RepID=UPI0023D909DB|nr:uncharacterized protein LOC105213679 isoform X1 [Zeugodacus cucurbitae]XP_028896572.2 uncharacterized protein LOC105213679 isoform X1 [Zeugodacus cucurbitae]XP_028896581.2 uncharacterized protein LOC105213679 isoform X1 [Zeugodacus cucurbitae]
MPTNPLPSNKETRKQNKSYYNKLRKKFRVYSSKRLQQTNSKIRNKKTRNVQTKVNKMPAITSEATPDKRPAPTRCLRPLRATVLAAATAAASMLTSAATAAAAAAAAATASYTTTTGFVNYNNHNSISTREPDTLERRLQPDVDTDTGGGSRVGVNVDLTNAAAALPNRLANKLLTNFLPAINAVTNATTTTTASSSPTISSSSSSSVGGAAVTYPTFRPPSIENLVASSAEDLSNFRDVSFDIFDDDDDLFGSPLAFDASDNGLWNGRFVPPPPRPPFLVDEPVLSDGLTTCDLCSWAMPTKSTFMFEGTIEKASELGWPLTLIIVSVLSALLGAIVMVTVVRCRRKKPTNNRNGKCTKLADDEPIPYIQQQHHHHHHLHNNQQLQYNHQHLNQHYPYQHQHNQNLNQYVHEHQRHLYPTAYRNLHAQYPLSSHHNTMTTHHHQQQQQHHNQQQQHKRLPQPLPMHYVSHSCSSSSLTNDSQSTQRTSLSTIYRPPSYYSSATVHEGTVALTKAAQKQKLLKQRIDMFTRSLPPPPSPPAEAHHDAVIERSCNSSIASHSGSSGSGSGSSRRGDDESICSDSYAESSVAYEEPTTLEIDASPVDEADMPIVEAAVMVAEKF